MNFSEEQTKLLDLLSSIVFETKKESLKSLLQGCKECFVKTGDIRYYYLGQTLLNNIIRLDMLKYGMKFLEHKMM